jgi:hypothetical protein
VTCYKETHLRSITTIWRKVPLLSTQRDPFLHQIVAMVLKWVSLEQVTYVYIQCMKVPTSEYEQWNIIDSKIQLLAFDSALELTHDNLYIFFLFVDIFSFFHDCTLNYQRSYGRISFLLLQIWGTSQIFMKFS